MAHLLHFQNHYSFAPGSIIDPLTYILYEESLKTGIVLEKPKYTLMQIWKSLNIFVKDFILKHLPFFEICSREICEKKTVYKYLETIEYVKN